MTQDQAESGIASIGPLPWGTHFCQFYDTAQDLRDTVVPYFRAGLTRNESCLWVTAPPLEGQDALDALRSGVPEADALLARGQLEIVDSRTFFNLGSPVKPEQVIASWGARTQTILDQGYEGLRVAGNTFWLTHPDAFPSFDDFERAVNRAMRGQRIVCLCGYCLDDTQATDVLDVVRTHEFALARRRGHWELVESASLKVAKERLAEANEALEQRVLDRTGHLQRALADREVLLKEIHHRVKNNLQMITGLLFLKARDPLAAACREVLDDIIRRVNAVGLVHETLYLQEGSHQIDFSAYLEDLARTLALSYGVERKVGVRVAATGAALALSEAVPVSLIATEVITNALKHAFPDGAEGAVEISFVDQGPAGQLLTVQDNGSGLACAPARRGLGMALIDRLAAQVGARAAYTCAEGTKFELRLPPALADRARPVLS